MLDQDLSLRQRLTRGEQLCRIGLRGRLGSRLQCRDLCGQLLSFAEESVVVVYRLGPQGGDAAEHELPFRLRLVEPPCGGCDLIGASRVAGLCLLESYPQLVARCQRFVTGQLDASQRVARDLCLFEHGEHFGLVALGVGLLFLQCLVERIEAALFVPVGGCLGLHGRGVAVESPLRHRHGCQRRSESGFARLQALEIALEFVGLFAVLRFSAVGACEQFPCARRICPRLYAPRGGLCAGCSELLGVVDLGDRRRDLEPLGSGEPAVEVVAEKSDASVELLQPLCRLGVVCCREGLGDSALGSVAAVRGGPVTAVGAATAIVVGLVVVTPAAGYISPASAIAMGAIGAFPSYFALIYRGKTKLDDSLDVVAAHGLGGATGAILTGVFASAAWSGGANGLVGGHPGQVLTQMASVVIVLAYSGGMTFVLLKVLSLVMPLRIGDRHEGLGLDVTDHGEEAYTHGDGAIVVKPKQSAIAHAAVDVVAVQDGGQV